MSQKWKDAARACEDAEQDGHSEEVLAQATTELDAFFASSDGKAALTLLRTSGRHITVAETDGDGGYGIVYAVTGDGLVVSFESMGLWTAYAKNPPKPNISRAITIKFVEAVCSTRVTHPKNPDEILDLIKKKLDTIADQIQSRSKSKKRRRRRR